MRTDQEVVVTDLVHKNHKLLIERGVELMQKDEGGDHIGAAVFSQLLDGCLLTLAYSAIDGHQLCILSWHFTDPALN